MNGLSKIYSQHIYGTQLVANVYSRTKDMEAVNKISYDLIVIHKCVIQIQSQVKFKWCIKYITGNCHYH